MLYPTHIAAAYLLTTQTALPTSWLIAGAAIPDIIDKPLPRLGLTENYHSVAHSAFFPVALLMLGALIDNPLILAFAVGWVSHLGLDILNMLFNDRPKHIEFTLWPFISQNDPMRLPPGAFFKHYIGTRSSYIEIGIWLLTIIALVAQFTPFLW